MKFVELLKLVESAKTAEEVVGPDDDGRARRVKRARAELHPDLHDGTDKVQAEHAFARLEQLLDDEKRHVKATVHAVFDITTRKRAYLVDGLAFRGHVANLYNVRYVRDPGGSEKTGLLKVARSPRDNDLISAEGKALAAMWKDNDDRRSFIPRPEEVFTYRDTASHIDRRAIVQRRLSGFVSLAEVFNHFPHGNDFRDLAWIWRRTLAGISLAHDHGYVHGSVTPSHVLIHPEVHGVQIVGWGQSVESGDTIKLVGDSPKKLYAPEVLNKEPASPATDIYSLSRMFGLHVKPEPGGKGAYAKVQAFVRGCTFERPKARPQDALLLLEEFDQMLERLYGPRKFRVFPEFPGRSHDTTVK